MQSKISTVVVVGSSAGGMEALTGLVSQLSADFPTPVFIVNHMSSETTGKPLLEALNRAGSLKCSHATDGEVFKGGHVYLAPSDQHLLLVRDKMLRTLHADRLLGLGLLRNTSRPRMLVTRPLVVLFLSLYLASCVDRPTPENPGTVRDSAGITLIDIPPDSEAGPVVKMAIDSAWGAAVGLEFGELSDVLVAPDGHLFFLDALTGQMHTRSASGGTWTSFGRHGDGQGEFSSRGLLGPLLATDSSVLVPDLDRQHMTEFSFEGGVLDVRPYPLMAYAVDWRRHPDGGLVFRSLDENGDALVRWAGDQIDTLYSFPIVVEAHNLILQPWALWDFTPDGKLVSGRSDEGAVILRGNGAQPSLRITRFSISEDPIGAEEEAYILDLVVESVKVNQPGCTGETLADARAATTLPERAPLLAGIMVSPVGDIWVHRAKEVLSMDLEALRIGSAAGYGGERWDVLNAEGLLRVRVRLPTGFSPRQFAGPWLYGVLEDQGGTDTPARVRVDAL